jgi:AbrB family looped-hinge helix DNA binding protein
MAEPVKLSSKGQLVLPKRLRDRHGWTAGTELVIEDRGSHLELREPPAAESRSWSDLFGAARYRGRRRSLADMDRGVAAEAGRRR